MDYVRAALHCLTQCFCKEDTTTAHGAEPNERTHLIDPVSSSPMRRSNSDDFRNEYPNSLPKHDVQNALVRIVQDNASNVIDVAAMDSHNLQPQEISNRLKVYSQKMAQQWNCVKDGSTKTQSGLLRDMPNPELLLAGTPIGAADLYMMRNFAHDSCTAINQIQIEHREVVVPFDFRLP